jgi:heat shock protein HslJ
VRLGSAWFCLVAAALAACAATPDSGSRASSGAPASAVAAPAGAASLVGTRWRGLIDPATDDRYAPWLEFVSEGRVSGYTGCNLLHGAWKSEGGAVHVGPLVTTKRACAGPEQNIERRVIAALNERSRVSREGNKLVFTTADGERLEFAEAR